MGINLPCFKKTVMFFTKDMVFISFILVQYINPKYKTHILLCWINNSVEKDTKLSACLKQKEKTPLGLGISLHKTVFFSLLLLLHTHRY